MANEKPKIKIDDPITSIDKKFDLYIKFVVGVLIVALVTMIVMVATLVIDSFHFNSATYKEYSQKTESIENIQKASEALLKQNQELTRQNKQNQELIIESQKQIKQLIEKK